MDWTLWWGIGLLCVLILVFLPWRATGDAADQEVHDRNSPPSTRESPSLEESDAEGVTAANSALTDRQRCPTCGTANDLHYPYPLTARESRRLRRA